MKMRWRTDARWKKEEETLRWWFEEDFQVHTCIKRWWRKEENKKEEKYKKFNTSLALPLPTSTNSIVDAAHDAHGPLEHFFL